MCLIRRQLCRSVTCLPSQKRHSFQESRLRGCRPSSSRRQCANHLLRPPLPIEDIFTLLGIFLFVHMFVATPAFFLH
ncbi:unnamed protein product [Protopolystoma xenopodis]|uniref:Uncharacterized protein n=1 Tax=Protopolystoma xenopodis TaxID=117903 RepID=A0A3S5AGV5_9PLAT|nr:unnamed protein product [Protopolystoma xenopodis]